MGCTCSKDEAKNIMEAHSKKLENPYIIKVNVPETDKIKLIFYEGKKSNMLLSEVLNYVFFCTDQCDILNANFISKYNKEKDEFEYFIERILGIPIENIEEPNKGKIWVCYINNKLQDWTFLCEFNRIVNKGDQIEFKFEKYINPNKDY